MIFNKNKVLAFLKHGLFTDHARIDASTCCQLKCVSCPHTKGTLGILGLGHLRFDNFKKFLDKYPSIKSIELSNYGEVFLNPNLKEIMEYAFIKNVDLTVLNSANLNTVKDDVLEALVKFQVKLLVVAIDGTNNETYIKYRRGGNFDKVIDNIKKINFYKEKYKSNFPKMEWQFIVFGHSEDEIKTARKMSQELNMHFRLGRNWDENFSPATEKGLGELSLYIEPNKQLKYKNWECLLLWFSPQLNWDGKLLGCNVNVWDDFGNVFTKGFRKCLNNEKYIYIKKMLRGKKPTRIDVVCYNCEIYRKMVAHNSYLQFKDYFNLSTLVLIKISEIFDTFKLFFLTIREYLAIKLRKTKKNIYPREYKKGSSLIPKVTGFWKINGEFEEIIIMNKRIYKYNYFTKDYYDVFVLNFNLWGKNPSLDISSFKYARLKFINTNKEVDIFISFKDENKKSDMIKIQNSYPSCLLDIPLEDMIKTDSIDFSSVTECHIVINGALNKSGTLYIDIQFF